MCTIGAPTIPFARAQLNGVGSAVSPLRLASVQTSLFRGWLACVYQAGQVPYLEGSCCEVAWLRQLDDSCLYFALFFHSHFGAYRISVFRVADNFQDAHLQSLDVTLMRSHPATWFRPPDGLLQVNLIPDPSSITSSTFFLIQ